MKLFAAFVGVVILLSAVVGVRSQTTQPPPYKVVFDLTSSDPLDQQAVIRWVTEIKGVDPRTEAEVVMYGRGLDLVVADKSAQAAAVARAINELHVSFKACELALRNQQIDKGRLLAKVETVPDGIGEIVSKQQSGWGYIKVGH